MNYPGINHLSAAPCFFVLRCNLEQKKPGYRCLLTLLLFALANCFSFSLSAQEEILINGQPCDMDGSAKRADVAQLNLHKNRYVSPASADFDKAITLNALLNSGDPNQFSQERAAVIRGYVYDVKVGGVETCNCKAKEPQYRDTHIELTPNETQTDARYRVVVEVTPRQRQMMADRGVDWSTTALRKNFKGKWVEVAGWLTYDDEHETAAYANDPDNVIGEKNWRATCWEVHPITYLKVVGQGAGTPLATIIREQAGVPKNKAMKPAQKSDAETTAADAPAKSSSQPMRWIVIGGLVVLVLAFFLLKNKVL